MEIWHPTKETLFEFHIHQVHGPMALKVGVHLEECDECKGYLADFSKLQSLYHDQPKEVPSDAVLENIKLMARKSLAPHWWSSPALTRYFWKPAFGLSFIVLISVSSHYWITSKAGSQKFATTTHKDTADQVFKSAPMEEGMDESDHQKLMAGMAAPAPAQVPAPTLSEDKSQELDDRATGDAERNVVPKAEKSQDVVNADGLIVEKTPEAASLQTEALQAEAKKAKTGQVQDEQIEKELIQYKKNEDVVASSKKEVAAVTSADGTTASSATVEDEKADPIVLGRAAKNLEARGRYDKAEKVYARMLRENPGHPQSASWQASREKCLKQLQQSTNAGADSSSSENPAKAKSYSPGKRHRSQ